MKKNIPLLKKLRTRFLRMRHPKHFDMHVIAQATDCGAAMCLIGHTLTLAGYKMRKRGERDDSVGVLLEFDFIAPNGRRVKDTFDKARQLLGLSFNAAYDLFHDFDLKTPEQAARRIEKIIAEAEG